MAVTNFSGLNLKLWIGTGGAAGTHTVTGIALGDTILAVQALTFGTDGPLADTEDLTSEFSISAANTITNAAGTGSTDGILMMLWLDIDDV